MKKTIFTFLIIILNLNLSFSQTKSEIDSLLNGISETENSKEITETEQAKKIIAFGENSLTTLAEFFTDSTLSETSSLFPIIRSSESKIEKFQNGSLTVYKNGSKTSTSFIFAKTTQRFSSPTG